ncbi:hypothetical protein GH714_029634 [Hevea brasiliensis]|uniref:PB1 domain-containing protein n=1 Tax=Hevea brasiliensis TaxID=3981 RepID=A0A6A6MJS6_HEVBR|nr:hypothetical protein GH714_029634 [Hevea brasiliensis]
MCSYGGKIHPRPHDNQLSYIGGETKILAVDRNIKFSVMISKLAAVCGDTDISFKYQLSGEDLDALISVTNDDDLEHMMHEYDRLYRASAKPARMRLFLFPVNPSPASFGSEGSKSERDRFVEALNSAPCHVPDTNKPPPNNVDFLFGLDKGSDPVNLQTQLQRIQIREQEQQTMYRKNSDDNLVAGYPGEYYFQKLPDKVPPVTSPVTVAPTVTAPTGYWPEKQIATGGYQPSAVTVTTTPAPPEQQQFYMFPGPAQGTVYHTPVMRPVTSQTGQPYYMQRMGGPDVYREQPVYNMVPQQQQPPPQISAATGPMGVVRPSGAGVG